MNAARRHGSELADTKSGGGALVLQYDVQSVDDSGDVTQDCEQDVDQEVGTAASLEEDSYGRQDDGNNDLGDVAGCERHGE